MSQSPSPFRSLLVACLLASPLLATAALPADPPDSTLVFQAGLACSNFDLKLDTWDGKLNEKQLKDRNGYLRVLLAGTGSAWRLTNQSNGKSISTRNVGASALIQVYRADGSINATIRGHSLFIWFPSDLPPGPSTTLLSGQVVYSLSPAGVGNLVSVNGNSTDVCTALS